MTRCSGNWARFDGKPFIVTGSTEDGNEESGIRRLSWNSSCQHFLRTSEQWYERPWVSTSRTDANFTQRALRNSCPGGKTPRGHGKAHYRHKKLQSFAKKFEELSMEKCTITAELAQRTADLQRLDAREYKNTVAEAMVAEPPSPDNLTEGQENFWIEKQAEANAAKRALHELETQSFTKRPCTTKTPQTEQVEFVPPDPTEGPSQASQVGEIASVRHQESHRTRGQYTRSGQRCCFTSFS